jgi:predicted nucleic acid-binding protein
VIRAVHARYVLDASVAAKWFTRHSEADRERAIALRDLHRSGRCRLVIPEFALLEVLNAVRYSPRADEEDTAVALAVLRDLQLEIERLDSDLLRKAVATGWAYGVALHDALYVALAERLGFPLVTSDHRLLRSMQGHSIVLSLRDLEFK